MLRAGRQRSNDLTCPGRRARDEVRHHVLKRAAQVPPCGLLAQVVKDFLTFLRQLIKRCAVLQYGIELSRALPGLYLELVGWSGALLDPLKNIIKLMVLMTWPRAHLGRPDGPRCTLHVPR